MYAENVMGRPSRYPGHSASLAAGISGVRAYMERCHAESLAMFRGEAYRSRPCTDSRKRRSLSYLTAGPSLDRPTPKDAAESPGVIQRALGNYLARYRIVLLLVAALGSGCDIFRTGACSLIGCTGLVVEVTGAPVLTPITIVVTAPDGSTRSATCTAATGTCSVSFYDFTPASITIRVSTATQTTEVTRQPMYEVTRPNGPECPPECRGARVTVVW
jgi:hypothetical protein